LCSYNFHWFLTPRSFSGSEKASWSVRHKTLHLILCVAALAGAAYFGWQLRSQWLWLAATALLTFLYSAPMIPHTAARLLWRIAVGKTLFLAFAWTHVTAFLPLALEQRTIDNQEMVYVINRFFLIYAICILFDYRDREHDRQQGLRSVVTTFEPAGVHRFFWGTIAASGATSILLFFAHFSAAATLALATPGVVTALLAGYCLRNRSDYLFYGVLDGLMALSLPLLVLF
jgi:4-hydroxybenzoate polyprenyltransferase